MPLTTSCFDLPDHLAAKADPALVADDDRHFAAVAEALERSAADLTARLEAARRAPGGTGQEAMDRDLEVHRLIARLRALRRYGVDLCLGRVVPADGGAPVHVGRLGLADAEGRRLLVDWRSPAAEPFFAATRAAPMGVASRRRYRWSRGRVVDYWDEVLTAGGSQESAALDDESAFLASLGSARSGRMPDMLGTIQADQDAAVRAGAAGPLVVAGGPGTGKTVVALHRAAYLLYADSRLAHRRGRVLVVGPHQPYLAHVADVLPSLGEEGVQTCTLRDLVPEGAAAAVETDPHVAALKASADLVAAVEPAVRLSEEPPTAGSAVETPWGEVWLGAETWAEAFDAPGPGTPHDEARDQLWEVLAAAAAEQLDGDVPEELVRAALQQDEELVAALHRAWPVLDPAELVGDLWSVPAYLRRCAPWLDRERMDRVVEDLLAADDSEMQVMSILRGQDLRAALVDDAALPEGDPDALAGPFAHVVVDEAQELTDAEWCMVLRRCPSGSATVVGDRSQARRGFPESWPERLARVGLDRVRVTTLRVNSRTPVEVMAEAEPVIRAVLPDADVPTSVRSTGVPVVHGSASDLPAVLDTWLAGHAEGTACVIAAPAPAPAPAPWPARPRVRVLTPELAKGLEFDLVVLLDPAS